MSEMIFLGQKLSQIRKNLGEIEIKKSGENSCSGFKYFELDDILPHIKELAAKYQVFNKIDFESDRATLTIINNEKPEEQFVFTSTIAEAKMKGCNDIQNLGGTQTYLRRYLYMNAYEITDRDSFDGTMGVKEARERAIEIYNIGGQAGYSVVDINTHIKSKFNCSIEKLLDDNSKQVLAGYKNIVNKRVSISKGNEQNEI